jgi:hypothetical protein
MSGKIPGDSFAASDVDWKAPVLAAATRQGQPKRRKNDEFTSIRPVQGWRRAGKGAVNSP